MKINEVIESREHIKTYWALKSVNIDYYKLQYNKLTNAYIATKHLLLRSDLLSLYSYLDELLRNAEWQNLEDDIDFDFDSVYDELLDIQDEIKEFLTNTK